MASAQWDPGKPTLIRLLADGSFAVPSFRGETKEYKVSLETGSCTCPQHRVRGVQCKHQIEVARQAPFLRAVERAKELTDAALDVYLQKYATSVVIGGALRAEKARRKQAQRPPIGSSVKVFGPTNDKEAFDAQR